MVHRKGKFPCEGHAAGEVVEVHAAALEGGAEVAAGPLLIVHMRSVEVGGASLVLRKKSLAPGCLPHRCLAAYAVDLLKITSGV